MDTPKLPEGITQEQIDGWKAKHGEILMLRLPLDDTSTETYDVLARKPDRQVLGQYLLHADKNPDKANDILVRNCLLNGYERVSKDVGLFLSAVTALADFIPVRKAEVVKL